MRLKERGLGTGAIVAIVVGIVVATVVPVTIAAVLLSGSGGGGGGTGGSGTGGSIVGTWQGTHLGETETFVFKSGGAYDWSSGGSQQSGSWSMSGDILTLDSYQFKVVFGTNSMQWYEKDPYTNDWMTDPSRSFTKVA